MVGPAIAHFGWTPTSYDELAGAVVAGHVIECGAQATGGNLAGYAPDGRPLGFPLAEIGADGSCVVTKHDGTGGVVSVDTVTAQLVYEIQSATYLGPDVSTHLDTVVLTPDGPDRVRVSGVRGSPPPDTLKVCVNELGGWRNTAEFVLVGLDIDEKAAWVRSQVTSALAGDPPASVEWTLARTDHEDADTEEAASCRLRLSVRDPDRDKVGKAFTAPLVELALASYAGFTLTGPPAPATAVRRLPARLRPPVRRHRAGRPPRRHHPRPAPHATPPADPSHMQQDPRRVGAEVTGRPATGPTRRVPLGTVVLARSGDKGGDANIGVWARDGRADRAAWLLDFLTPERVRALLPEAADLVVEVFPLANLGAVNVLVHGLLGEGVAASTRFDPQAKALGEWLRSRHVDVPEALL